jgi:hypothetical protein
VIPPLAAVVLALALSHAVPDRAPHAVTETRQKAIRPSGTALRGTASWGNGWTGVVTRLPRGTVIRVCGPLGCWSGRSVGYGPAVRTHRVADLSRSVFSRICGDPSAGLCRVSIDR